jgi:hypothetical protein
VDPIFVYLSFTGNVNYDSRKTNISATDLASKIYDKIVNYVDQDLEKFNRELYFSDFSAQIDKIDNAILSNELDIKMEYRLAPILGSNQSYEFSYGNGIYHPHDGHIPVLSTSSFTHFDGSIMGKSFIEDDGKGALKLYTFKAGEKYIYNNNIGSVDYATGKVVIKGFAPTQIENTTHIKFYAPPAEPDITLKRNIILTMDQYDTNAVVLTMVDKSRPGTVGETRYLGGKTY